jgi:hypothetical protein
MPEQALVDAAAIKNGSTINSHVSLSTRDGGGSVAPAFLQSSSQNNRSSVTTTSGE